MGETKYIKLQRLFFRVPFWREREKEEKERKQRFSLMLKIWKGQIFY